jgi:iron complex transport system ATP-binding protein
MSENNSSHAESALLKVSKLRVVRGGQMLLDDVSFSVNAGEILALLGANGAGKSTLFAALAGEDVPAQGTIAFDGKSLAAYAALELAERRALNAVEPPLAFSLSVFDVVALGRPFVAVDRNAVERALEDCHAAHWAARDATTLSSGEMLRVQLARSLYQMGDEPRCLWLLDEPFAHLDLAQRKFVLELLRRIANERQWAIIFSSHEPRDAEAIADNVLLLREAKVIAYGAVAQTLRHAELSACYGITVTLNDVGI